MLVVPQANLASDINLILSKIRRGIALARQDSQNNPPTNMMVDLPDGIDFEVNLIRTYQTASLERVVSTSSVGNNVDSETSLESGTGTSGEAGQSSEISSSSGASNESGLSTSSQSEVDAGHSEKRQVAGNGRLVKTFDDDTGGVGPNLANPIIYMPGGGTTCPNFQQ